MGKIMLKVVCPPSSSVPALVGFVSTFNPPICLHHIITWGQAEPCTLAGGIAHKNGKS
jgi:hypothetical protein